MSKLQWDVVGERTYETGVDHGVLYIPDEGGAYSNGVAWSGLTTFTESPEGAESTPIYADNIEYITLTSVERYKATIEALTYPEEFNQFDGVAEPVPGVGVGQQNRGFFGLCYRTIKGNDVAGNDFGYKLHLVYGCKAAPSEKAHATVNDTPEANPFSWALTATAQAMPDPLKPSATITIDSTKVDPDRLAALETLLYGATGVDPVLPSPATVIATLGSDDVVVTPSVPAFNSGTNTITIPTVAGVAYFIDDLEVPAGAVVITANKIVVARPTDGHIFASDVDDDWLYTYTP